MSQNGGQAILGLPAQPAAIVHELAPFPAAAPPAAPTQPPDAWPAWLLAPATQNQHAFRHHCSPAA